MSLNTTSFPPAFLGPSLILALHSLTTRTDLYTVHALPRHIYLQISSSFAPSQDTLVSVALLTSNHRRARIPNPPEPTPSSQTSPASPARQPARRHHHVRLHPERVLLRPLPLDRVEMVQRLHRDTQEVPTERNTLRIPVCIVQYQVFLGDGTRTRQDKRANWHPAQKRFAVCDRPPHLFWAPSAPAAPPILLSHSFHLRAS